MKQTRRPEDEEQLNKTPETLAAADAPQEEPAYSLEEIMNEFGGWTKREDLNYYDFVLNQKNIENFNA